jgi:3-deoxy-D-manno-octulosonic-acid transferase
MLLKGGKLTRFDLLYLSLTPAALPLLLYKRARYGKYRESGPAMFGKTLSSEPVEIWRNGCVWVHAVSVGEVLAAKAMLPHLREKFESLPILLTTVTETGQAQAKDLPPELFDAVRYYPADFSWIVARFLDVFKPRVYIAMETELWPNALNMIHDRGAKLFVLNGKISDRSARSYNRVKSLFQRPLGGVSAFCMQTQNDADRISQLTGSSRNVFVTGNCKFDIPYAALSPVRAAELRRDCQIPPGAPVIVAGSTHPGEEAIMLETLKSLNSKNAVLLVVPRHPERFDEAWRIIKSSGLPALRLNTGEQVHSGPLRVVLIDRMRLLAELYGIATVAIVCGSFVPGIGGHNLLEAAAHGIPVFYGPHMEKQPDMVRILDQKGGIRTNAQDLTAKLNEIIADPEACTRLGEQARNAVTQNRGSASKNIEIISQFV